MGTRHKIQAHQILLWQKQQSKSKRDYATKHTKSSLIIAGITGHNNLAYFQSKLDPCISPRCRLCGGAYETLYHLMTDYEATCHEQTNILKNKIPLPDGNWSIKDTMDFISSPKIHHLLNRDTPQNEIEIIYQEHNYSSSASSDI